jgi:KUP system potassium uptake protein
MKLHFWLKEHSLSEERGFGLDVANVTVEKFPLIVAPVTNLKLKRIERLELWFYCLWLLLTETSL